MTNRQNLEIDSRLDIHNSGVDESVAWSELCGNVHLPSGRICVAPVHHHGSCRFVTKEKAQHLLEGGRRELAGVASSGIDGGR